MGYKDQWVFAGGAEFKLDENWRLGVGYNYGTDPVAKKRRRPVVQIGHQDIRGLVSPAVQALEHHTLVHDMQPAVALALDLEWFCGVVRRARAHGEPVTLPPDEIALVAQKFASYGQG